MNFAEYPEFLPSLNGWDFRINLRIHRDTFRAEIHAGSDAGRKGRLNAQYDWFKQRWFDGQESKRGPSINASLTQDGVPCLPGECER